MKKKTSITVDSEALEKIKKLGINLSSLIEHAVEEAVELKRCPTCGQKVKVKK
jgi:post-segregation antitoxin (ccd killing protein)